MRRLLGVGCLSVNTATQLTSQHQIPAEGKEVRKMNGVDGSSWRVHASARGATNQSLMPLSPGENKDTQHRSIQFS